MAYNDFTELPVWNDAIELADGVFTLTENQEFHRQGDLANQLQRAAVSVSNNIAEGYERGTSNELLQFLNFAKGSAGEVRSMCFLLLKMKRFSPLRGQIQPLLERANSIGRQLGAWARSQRDSGIEGRRTMTADEKEERRQQDARERWKRQGEEIIRSNIERSRRTER